MNIKEVAADLRYCRRESGLSGTDVSHLLAMTPSRLSRIETGKSEPRPTELVGFALIYGKSYIALFPGLAGNMSYSLQKRLEKMPEEPHNWRAHDARLQSLQYLHLRLQELNPSTYEISY